MPPPLTPPPVRIWDLPTRLFHWALTVCVAGLFATAYVPGASIEHHARFGYAVLTLLLFRLVWGFAGGHWSRFSTFFPRPAEMRAYLRGDPTLQSRPGHNPIGALAVFLMLLVLAVQVGSGLLTDDEIAFTGPLNRYVSASFGLTATAWHTGPGQWMAVAVVALHLLAIVFYLLVRRRNLIGPMVHGDQPAAAGAAVSRDTGRSRLLALAVLAVCAAVVYSVVRASGPVS